MLSIMRFQCLFTSYSSECNMQHAGITDERYLKVLSSTANEKLSEGASGAFMFFCGGGEFIVKTIKAREAKVLHQSLRTYHAYLKNNKQSLLCRFLGSYSLGMYAQTFYFVVMANCFDPRADINERYVTLQYGTQCSTAQHSAIYLFPPCFQLHDI